MGIPTPVKINFRKGLTKQASKTQVICKGKENTRNKTMKAYNIFETVKTTEIGDIPVKVLSLGETGRGRVSVKIPVKCDTGLVDYQKRTVGNPAITESTSPEGWLMRISTYSAYIRDASGSVCVPLKQVDEFALISKGRGAFGDAGRTGTWDDVLIRFTGQESIVRIKPSRGNAYFLLVTPEKVTEISRENADTLGIDIGQNVELREFWVRL